MDVNLDQIWKEIQASDRKELIGKWNRIRLDKLNEFRAKSSQLNVPEVVEPVQWEEIIGTKGYVIDRNSGILYEGSGFSVYPARKQFSSESVFCKVYQIKRFSELHSIADLIKQVANLSLIKSDSVVAFQKAFDVKNTQKVYLFMSHPTCGTTAEYLAKRKQPVPLSMAKRWSKGMASGLSYLHTLGLAHNNLTLSSVMLTNATGDVQIFIPDVYVEALGTEKMFRTNHDACLSDMWQMACIHYYVLTLQHPFTRRTEPEFKQDMDSKYWSFVGEYDTSQPKLDQPTKDFLGKLFVPESDRLTSIEILNHPYLASN